MIEYILDANAVIRHFKGGQQDASDGVSALVRQTQRGQSQLSMSVVNAGEVFYVLLKEIGKEEALRYLKVLQHTVSMVDADFDQTLQAASLKHQYKLGYADSFAAALAISRKATLVSADPSFEKLGRTIKWLKLPRYRTKGD